MSARRRLRWLAALYLLALTARGTVYLLGSDRPSGDELAYREVAVAVAAGHGLERAGRPETHIAPLWPLLHALPIALGADPHGAGRGLALGSSALAAPLLVWALAPLVDRRWLLAGGLATALHPRLLVTAERMQPEALAALLLLVFAGSWARDRPWGVALAAAGAYLARPEAVVLLPVAWIAVALRDRGAWRRWLGPSAVALLLVLPYLVHLRLATGDWVVTGKSRWVYALGVAQVERGDEPMALEEVRRLEREIGSPWEHVTGHPLSAAAGYLTRLARGLGYLGAAVWWPLAALGVLGLAGWARAGAAAGGLVAALALLLLIPIGMVHARHVLPYVPLILGAAAHGASHVALFLGPRGVRMLP